jgi:transposase
MSYQNFIGLDISKSDFVSATFGSKITRTYANKTKGWQTFFDEHAALLPQSLVVLETTGGHEMGLLRQLIGLGVLVHRADTRKVKNFIRSHGQYAKTDRIDALGIAQYASERHQKLRLYEASSEEGELLKNLAERRRDLVQMSVQEQNRLTAPESHWVKASLTASTTFLKEQIKLVEAEIDALISRSETLKKKRAVLMGIPGIGKTTAQGLLAYVPELGHLDRKKIASLCGLAPHPKQSGKKTWRSTTFGGRRNMRPILFLAALAATRSKNTLLSAFYASLIARGKKPLVALIALMRKIIVIANARVRDEVVKQDAAPVEAATK